MFSAPVGPETPCGLYPPSLIPRFAPDKEGPACMTETVVDCSLWPKAHPEVPTGLVSWAKSSTGATNPTWSRRMLPVSEQE